MNDFVILDFETTGLSPEYARIIEVGAVVVQNNKIVGKLSQLMDPGCYIPDFITEITGITPQMVRGQPTPEKTMLRLKKFIGNKPILAHNASFDQKFLISEMQNVGVQIRNKFLCTLKLSRRLINTSPDYKLSTLVSHLKIKLPKQHKAHRALDDVRSTFHLWCHLKKQVSNHINSEPSFELMRKIEQCPKDKIKYFLGKHVVAKSI